VTGAVSATGPRPLPAGNHAEEGGARDRTPRQKASEFTAPSYYRGGFTPVKLADFAGKWILVCFYPGDFTFV
jgi:peroxiredoxin (alkyl hydroperoxide reductase subunit C)